MGNKNIAIISPNQNAYSETFIQAQKKYLKGNVFYYFGGAIPTQLEGGSLKLTRFDRFVFKIQKKFKQTNLSLNEFALVKSFQQQNISVVLAQYATTAHHLIRVCKLLNLPLITHFHGYDASIHRVLKAHHNFKEVFDYSSYVIAVSKKMETQLLSIGCPNQKLIYNVYGPQPEFFEVIPQFSKKQLIAIGRFTDKKAPYYTILAFKEVVKKIPDAQLIMAGDGLLFDVCKNLVAFYNLQNNIKLVGVITPEKFRAYLTESMAFVQHSITPLSGDMEGTPLAILESSAAGLPVISTNHAGIPDVIIDNETGFLVTEHDVEGMTLKMIEILENPTLAKEMGLKGRKNIKNNFYQQRYIDVLDGLIDSFNN
ncbi:glycosyltransferase [Lutibacter sp. HS1-25]|uniref:glycosyltransferase n=1 Tax=Lutibacter sp. HS1-25 TaxID=2485000 RepID=UPI001010809A|nr:glycosyltransferase [Lutibacter sp. HS1-25]RXP52921.1 glycosyltransferase [Lutibacter sp. HS1-25]